MKPIPEKFHVLHTESSPSLGGQELRILLEMEILETRGITSTLVARPNTPIMAEAQRRKLHAIGIPMRTSLDPLSMLTLFKLMRQYGTRVVNAHNSKDAWNVLPLAKGMGLATVRSRHIANPIRRSRLSQLVYGRLADVVMTTSESIRDGLIAAGVRAEKIVSIPTGVDLTRFEHAHPGSLRADLNIPLDALLAGQVSVLRGDKGPELFVSAAIQLLESGSPAYFVLVGDGGKRQQVADLISQSAWSHRIKMAGYRRDIPEILADLDVFVLAAKSPEGVPQAILQAHAARIPVVSTTVGGVAEVAIHGSTSLSVAPRDAQALAHAIQTLLTNQPLAQRLAQGGRELVETRYSLSIMADRMETLYRQLATPLQR